MLFNQTKALFDAWIRQMISYTLQPVILSAFLGIFIAVLSSLFKELYALKVCWATPQDKIANGWHFVDPITEEILPTGRDAEPPISLESLLMLFFFAWMFSSYLKLAEKFGQAIAQSTTGTLGDAIAISKHFNR
jgi:type IV secretory pathway VirB6-like protein